MKPRQKYVRLTEAQILVLPKHKAYAEEYSAARGISINQVARDLFDHAMDCPFFNGNILTNEKNPPVRSE